MKTNRLIALVAGTTILFSALACSEHYVDGVAGDEAVDITGSGQSASAFRPYPFNLTVSGDGNAVQVPCGSIIRRLAVSGVNHDIRILPGAEVGSIRLSGVGSTIHLPADLHPPVYGSGVNNQVVNDVEGVGAAGIDCGD